MRILLDTYAFLWFIAGDAQLSTLARSVISDPAAEPLLSIASVWEMAIKVSLGKLIIAAPGDASGVPFNTFVSTQLRHNGIALLPITVDHAAQIITLPFHHRDPFDRLLVAQAMIDRLPIVSADPIFSNYPVQRMW